MPQWSADDVVVGESDGGNDWERTRSTGGLGD